jgi:hypothetical protein
MYIAIDDTYGPNSNTNSKYVTGNRRTSVGLVFLDQDVQHIREQMIDLLEWIKKEFSIQPSEFHFVDIYNRNPPWNKIPESKNLMIFSLFSDIYKEYKWKVFIQTIDDRTLMDHKVKKILGKINQFNLEKPSDLSLFLLLIKIKNFYSKNPESLVILIDEGLGKPNARVGHEVFHDYKGDYSGLFQSSKQEPLLQLADFMAFALNRTTHLYMKQKRSHIDNWFLELINDMKINSTDLTITNIKGDYSNLTVKNFDEAHEDDRKNKGL